jgi:hypothetical protein
MSTTRLRFLCLCVRAGGWNENCCCCYSKGCTDIHFLKFGSALVSTTALEGSLLDGRARSGKIDRDRLLGVLAVKDLSGAQ